MSLEAPGFIHRTKCAASVLLLKESRSLYIHPGIELMVRTEGVKWILFLLITCCRATIWDATSMVSIVRVRVRCMAALTCDSNINFICAGHGRAARKLNLPVSDPGCTCNRKLPEAADYAAHSLYEQGLFPDVFLLRLKNETLTGSLPFRFQFL